MDAGLEAVETREITVRQTFAGFGDFWNTTTASTLKSTLAGIEADTVKQLTERVSARLPTDTEGRMTYGARSNAVKSRVSKSA
jgi:hypothetical protein